MTGVETATGRRSSLAGALLAGGPSSRMGRTKGVIEVGGRRMIDRVIDAATGAGCDPLIVVGGDAAELAPLDVQLVPDRIPGAGPAGGVLTALATLGDVADGVLVVPCDVPALTASALRPMVDRWRTQRRPGARSDVDAIVARTDRREPMCVIWSTTVADVLERAAADGVRAVHELLELVRVDEVDVDPGALRNVNTPADLDDLGPLGSDS